MEAVKEPISVRVARINAEITGRAKNPDKAALLNRETLLDVLQVLYDECSIENLQKSDSNVAEFVKKYKNAIRDIKALRVNITDFEIKNIIGCGHFGEVHVVKEKQTGDVYAMKTIRKFDNEIKRMSFEEERNIMAFTNSPWLTSLQYSFQDSSYLFFVMDYHPGGDLLGLLYRKGGTLPESAAVFYIAELILALKDLHAMGYVHRDIKPDNILLDRCGHLKLADFGSAAKLDADGMVRTGLPVGTPDYIAPEVLQCLDNKSHKNGGYGISCDFWSLGILAYELTIGNPPFQGPNSTAVYSKIMNHSSNLKFPPDVSLSQGYVDFIKSLVTDARFRLKPNKVKSHILFKGLNFDTLRDRVPPYVPKIDSIEDTRNFTDVQAKKKTPSIENFKKRSQFSGRNLPFVGFTFSHDPQAMFESNFQKRSIQKNEIVENLKAELERLRMTVAKSGDFNQEKEDLKKKLDDTSIKLQGIEALRDNLEKQLAESMAESAAVKRTLEIERKDRANLEKKALDLIKGAKLKWELAEKNKIDALDLEIGQLKAKIEQLNNTNRTLEEQLQHALKMEEKNRESLETQQILNRRSVVGLENILEKATTERQNKISELQGKLNDEISCKANLQHKVQSLQEALERSESELRKSQDKMKKDQSEHELLRNKLHDNEALIKELSSKVNELEKDLERFDDYEAEIESLRHMFEDSQKTIKDLQNKSLLLRNECDAMDRHKMESLEARQKTVELQKRISHLEKELEQEKEQSHTLKKRLDEVDSSEAKSQELREKQLQFYKVQKELSDCKIDKRILERELKEAKYSESDKFNNNSVCSDDNDSGTFNENENDLFQHVVFKDEAEIKQLHDKLANSEKVSTDNKKNHESAVLELAEINESISMELLKSKENTKMLREQLQNEKSKMESEKTVIKELKGFLTTKEDTIRNLESQINALQHDISNLNSRCKKEEDEKSKMMGLVEQLQKEKHQLNDCIEKGKIEMSNLNLNLDALREACILLESQVIEYEKLVAMSKMSESELRGNTEKLIADLCEARKETQEAKRQINEQKSLRTVAEQKIKRLEEDIECLEKECSDYKTQCIDYKQYSSGLSDELTGIEEKLNNADVTIKSYERQIEKLSSENNLLKEEISDHITKISHLKDTKYRLTHQVDDLNKNIAVLVQKITDLESTLFEKMNYYKEREMKAEARDKQHLKLIDYLQCKIQEQTQKKKTLTEVIFGSSKKENQPPISLALNYKDLEGELIKEKESNRKLKEEVFKLKAATICETNGKVMEKFGKMEKSKSEILTPKSKAALEQIATSPSSHKKEVPGQNSLKRMHHNIPHRFETKLNTGLQKCVQCHNQILLGRNCHVCKECKVVAHVVCSSALPKVCGLPEKFAEHYKESLENVGSSNGKAVETHEAVVCEGWIKVPCSKSNSWEKRYARLTELSLDLYTQPPQSSATVPMEKFPLKPAGSHGKVVLEPLQSEIGIPVANSDLPFIMKIEVTPETTCWPSKSIVMMVLSAKEKDSWFAGTEERRSLRHLLETRTYLGEFLALQKHFASDQLDSKLESVMKLPGNLVVNCILELTENIKLLGTDKGLYSCYENRLLQIDDVNVEQVIVFTAANVVLMIVGPKSTLISCDINHLINLTQCASGGKPTLKYKDINVNNLNGFHILQASKHSAQKKIAVATTKQLIILEYYYRTNEFVPVRILDTAQPTSCILFTENSLIVGADKFFEIDLTSFQAEEFLDVSDINLKQVLKCYKIGSFPISILEVSKNPKEYLLTFNEFSIFVDEYGRSSRQKEIKNEHLPLALHLAKNYLYVVQFAAVEILKITEETCNTGVYDSYRLELFKFKYLGSNSRGIFIEQDWEVKFLNARNLPDFDAVSIVSESTDAANDSNNSQFSFTSSMVQSLDGNLSDSTNLEHTDTIKRKVKFDQTDV